MTSMSAADDWKAEARLLRERGMKYREIAYICGKTVHQVHWVFVSPERRAKRQTSKAEQRRREQRPARKPNAHEDNSFTSPHTYRKPRRIIVDNPIAVCRRFAAGEIDRAELSRQLRGEL
jgi:hypothetical protein